MPRLVLVVVLLFAAPVARASAATGDLTQLPDPFGCNSFSQVNGVCTATTALNQVESVTVSPDGASVYAAASQSEAVVHFVRNVSTGSMDQPSDPSGCVSETGSGPCLDGEGLKFATGVAVSPDGRNVYATGANSNAVAIIDRDPVTGLLSQRTAGSLGCVSADGSDGTCVAAAGIGSGFDLVVSPDGKAVYVVGENTIVTLARDTATGNLSQALANGCTNESGTGGCLDGRALYDLNGIAISPDGKSVYTASAGTDNVDPGIAIFDRDPATGALTQRAGNSGCVTETGSAGTCADGRGVDTSFGVAVSPDNRNVYLPSRSGAIVVFDRDIATGAVTQKAGTAGCISQSPTSATTDDCALGHSLPSPTDVVVSPDGANVYMSSQDIGGVDIFDRSTTTGALVQRASPAGCVASAAFYAKAQCTPGRFMTNAWSVAVDPAGRNVYVGAHGSTVAVFARDGGAAVATPTATATGTLAPGTTPAPTALPTRAPTATPTPTRLPPTQPPSRIVTVHVTQRNGQIEVENQTPGAGTVTVSADGTIHVSSRSARIARRLLIARASKTVTRATRVTLVLKPKGKARRLLHRRGNAQGDPAPDLRADDGKATTSSRRVVFRYEKR